MRTVFNHLALITLATAPLGIPCQAQTSKPVRFENMRYDGKVYNVVSFPGNTKMLCRAFLWLSTEDGSLGSAEISALCVYHGSTRSRAILLSCDVAPHKTDYYYAHVAIPYEALPRVEADLKKGLELLRGWRKEGVPTESQAFHTNSYPNLTITIGTIAGNGNSFPSEIAIKGKKGVVSHVFHDLKDFSAFVDRFSQFKAWLDKQ